MITDPHSQEALSKFYAELDYASDAYADAIFTFLAIREDDGSRIIQGALYLLPATLDVKPSFETRKIFAGSYRLEKLGLRPRSFIDLMQKGSIDIDDRIFQFPGDRRITMIAPVVEQDKQSRQSILRIFSSENNHQLNHAEINLELMASKSPFDNLQELMNEYGVGMLRQDSIGIEIFTGNVALIDAKSKIEGEQAHLVVRIAKELKPEKFSLGYRLFQQRAVTERKRISGMAFEWLDIDRVKEGIATLAVPKGAVLQCYATYDGHVQHFFWLADPANTLNTKRLAFSTFDRDLTSLKNIIDADEERNRKARQLEIAISWLLWMLGFGAINLGNTATTQEAADLIATTPSGHFAVIECTIGQIKTDKMGLLHERALAVRRTLETTGNRHLRVLPVMITTMRGEDIQVGLEQAERRGIHVIAREGIADMLQMTQFPQDADLIYKRAEEAVKSAQAQFDLSSIIPMDQPNLPLME